MGHGLIMGKEHADLAERLKHGTVAMVEPEDPVARAAWKEILEILFSPEDAALASSLPVLPSSLQKIAQRTGIDAEDLRRRLDGMADRGLVLDVADPRTGETVYMLAPPMVGFFEFSMMRLNDGLPKERLARAYQAYTTADPAISLEISQADTLIGRTLAHETAPFDDLVTEVLDWERASAWVSAADRVSVTNCYCRHKALHLGTPCDYPMETCMSLGGGADYVIRHGLGREISSAEGLELLAAAREAGLVHIADNVKERVTYICSCCGCCCGQLHSVRDGMPVVVPSGFQPATDAEKCTGCGRCVRACPVQAISLVSRRPGTPGGNGGPHPVDADLDATGSRQRSDGQPSKRLLSHVDYDRCLGCAVCAGRCRHQALTMQRRPDQPFVPRNMVEFITRRMLERGRLSDLLVDGTAGGGSAWANAVLRAVTSLPPADRLVASEQVRSRFVQYALSQK